MGEHSGVPDLPHSQRVGRGKDVLYPGYGAGKKVLAMEKRRMEGQRRVPHHLKTISQDRNTSASSYWGGMDAREFWELTDP